MESLSTLPSKNDTVKTPEEEMILNQLFNSPPSSTQSQKQPPPDPSIPPPPSTHPRLNWKIIGITIGLFVVLANPWIDGLLSKIPYCGGSVSILGLKTLLFSILLVVVNLFL